MQHKNIVFLSALLVSANTHCMQHAMTIQLIGAAERKEIKAKATADFLELINTCMIGSELLALPEAPSVCFDVKYLDEDGFDNSPPMFMTINHPAEPIIQRLQYFQKWGADVNAKDKDGLNAIMHVAKCHKHRPLLQPLIDMGALLNEQDNEGNTALWHAVERGNEEVIKMLLMHDADITIKNEVGGSFSDYMQLPDRPWGAAPSNPRRYYPSGRRTMPKVCLAIYNAVQAEKKAAAAAQVAEGSEAPAKRAKVAGRKRK